MNDEIVRSIAEAEVVEDPLDDLVKRTALNVGAPFEPETLDMLRDLKRRDPACFESLRAQLRRAGCRVAELDTAIGGEKPATRRGESQADLLIELASEAELFRGTDGATFVDIMIEGHRETWPLRARGFRHWLTRRFHERSGGVPGSEALNAAINLLEARAQSGVPVRSVHVRVGGEGGRLYLDLGDASWRAVEIDNAGWRIVEAPPVRFRRGQGMQALPEPQPGGSIDTLRQFLNVRAESDFVLAVSWMLGVLRDKGPYPVLVLAGEQGSAKSTFSAMLRSLLDPMTAPLRTLPREERDLFIAASNGHVLGFDNLSGLPPWMSDTLCRLASGAGFAVRQLYTDQDEILFDAARPVILNGIEDVVARADLADRAILLTLEPIPEERRQPAAQLWAAFEAERPSLLGALLDVVSQGLRELPRTRLPRLPRMADFALWASACESALWPQGTFWNAYAGNRALAVDDVIEADALAAALRTFVTMRTSWTGTCSELLVLLGEQAGERVTRARDWPDNARKLGNRLRRIATFLRASGIEVDFTRDGRARARTVRLSVTPSFKTEEKAQTTSATSAPEADAEPIDAFVADVVRTLPAPVDDQTPALAWSLRL